MLAWVYFNQLEEKYCHYLQWKVKLSSPENPSYSKNRHSRFVSLLLNSKQRGWARAELREEFLYIVAGLICQEMYLY